MLVLAYSRCIAVITIATLTLPTAAQQWHSYKRAPDSVNIDYRYLERGHIEIKASRTLSTKLGAFLHLLEDTDKIHTWVARAKSAQVIAQPSPQRFVVHTRFKGTWPVDERDMVTQSEWQQNEETFTLTMTTSDASSEYDIPSTGVRMSDIKAKWQLQPLGQGHVKISYHGSAHPGGSLPLFLAKSAALKSIAQTFQQLPTALANHQTSYPGVIEPSN